MALFRIADEKLVRLPTTTFENEKIMEREHLQAYIQDNISVIETDADLRLMVLEEEYSDWQDSYRSIDLLCLDTNANLVVVELKRTTDGGHMELQALRYAAMVSTMTFEEASRARGRFQARRKIEGSAEEVIREFLGWRIGDDNDFANSVRIILASQDFSDELVTSIMWLSDHDIDIQCFKMAPYRHQDEILINIDQIFPLPEAEDYQIKIREKERRERNSKQTRDVRRFDLLIGDTLEKNLPKRWLVHRVIREAVKRGTPPRTVLAKPTAWIAISGQHAEPQFLILEDTKRDDQSSPANIAEFFTESDSLIHFGGKTYALKSNMWGPKALEDVDKIIADFDLNNVSYSEYVE